MFENSNTHVHTFDISSEAQEYFIFPNFAQAAYKVSTFGNKIYFPLVNPTDSSAVIFVGVPSL